MKSLPFLIALLIATAARPVLAAAPAVQFSTFLGGSDYDVPMAMTTGSDGSVYVTGFSASRDFPGGIPLGGGIGAFITRLSADGSTAISATVLGGIFPRAIAVDGDGNIYVAGYSFYNGFPVVNALQPELASVFDGALVKLNPEGTAVLFSTFLGGVGDDAILGMALDSDRNIWLTGITSSDDFPIRGGALQPTQGSGTDAFLTKVASDGRAILYSSYFGGTGGETVGRAIVVDAANRPVLAGRTSAGGFPIKNPLQTERPGSSDVFIAKFEANGQALVFSTLFGGSDSDSVVGLALDAAQNIYVSGITRSTDFPTQNAFRTTLAGELDIFVSKLNSDANAIQYSTYLGGSLGDTFRGWPNGFGSGDSLIEIGGLAVSPGGQAFVAGSTYSDSFPVVNSIKNRQDAYNLDAVAILFDATGGVVFSTYVGGSGAEIGYGAAVTADGYLIAGGTGPGPRQPDFPTTANSVQHTTPNEAGDAFVMKFTTAAPTLANDAFAAAAALEGSRLTVIAQTESATAEVGEPAHGANAAGKTAWFRWTAPAAGRVIINTTANFETVFAVYHGTAVGALTRVNPTIAAHETQFSEGAFPIAAGEMLHIAVDGVNGGAGAIALSLIVSLPDNDDYANRRILTGATASDVGSNVGSTTERLDRWEHSIWWGWTAPVAGAFTVTTVGTEFDNALALYAAPGLPFGGAILASGGYTNNLGRLTFRAEANQEFAFAVIGQYGGLGRAQINIAPANRPVNDEFANRILLTGRNESVTGTDFDAVYDPVELALQTFAELPIGAGYMVWWQWTAPIDGAVDISTVGSERVDGGGAPPTSILIFEGDEFPTTREAITIATGPTLSQPASIFLPTIRAGVKYQIGLDATDWQQPVNFVLKIRAIAPPRIIAGSAQIDGTGKFSARVEGIEGRNYRVTSSVDLMAWGAPMDFPAITGEFTFEAAAGGGARYFRIEEF